MSEPYMSEIKLVSFNFPPRGWALCNGQLLPINQNQALFSLLGTTYGGDGRVNFALPNLQGKLPMHMGNGHTIGETAGTTSVTVTQQQMPQHMHTLMASNNSSSTTADPTNAFLAPVNGGYGKAASLTALEPSTVSNYGGNQPHTNMMPYLVLNFIIALQGTFPSRN